MRRDFDEFTQRDTVILSIGPENAASFRNYWEKHDLPFIGLPDPDLTVLKAYGQQIKLLKFGRMPAQMIIDKRGILRFVYYGDSMSDIPSNEEMLELLDELEAETSPAEVKP